MLTREETAKVEEWRDVVGYEGVYQVSNMGRVKSLKRKNKCRHIKEDFIMKLSYSDQGYSNVLLSLDGKTKHFFVHRLVATAFIPLIAGKNFVNHINGNKADNSVENLEWVTHKENIKHSVKTGLSKFKSKEVHLFNKQKEFVKSFSSHIECAIFLDVSPAVVANAIFRCSLVSDEYYLSHDIDNLITKDLYRYNILHVDEDGKTINEFSSAKEAAKHLNLKNSGFIIKVCRGIYKQYNGYLFTFKHPDLVRY